jgi:hypothetical protein
VGEWYVSYAWGDDQTLEGKASGDIVSKLCAAAEWKGFRIHRDKNVLGLGDSISAFMKKMADADRIFVVMNKKYLSSAFCMFELSEIWRTSRHEGVSFLERVRIYVVDDVKVRNPRDWADWAIFWKEQHDELDGRARRAGAAILGEHGHRRLMHMQRYYTQVADIPGTLADIVQPRSFEELQLYGLDDLHISSQEIRHTRSEETRAAPDRQINLAEVQRQTKEDLRKIANDIHQSRITTLDRNETISIHDFSRVWETLFKEMFKSDQALSDFTTISSYALHRFQAYEFGRYYQRLFELQNQEYPSSKSKIKILMRCNEFTTYAKHVASEDLNKATWKVFEQAVETVLKGGKDTPPPGSPGQVYRKLASGGTKIAYEFRLINNRHISALPEDSQGSFDEPFNIYGKIARSRSLIPSAFWAPIPCLEVCFTTKDIEVRQKSFDTAWKIAESSIEDFANSMTDWSLFGEGKLMEDWVLI